MAESIAQGFPAIHCGFPPNPSDSDSLYSPSGPWAAPGGQPRPGGCAQRTETAIALGEEGGEGRKSSLWEKRDTERLFQGNFTSQN